MSDVFWQALIRAFILSTITTLTAIGTQLANTDNPRIIIAAGISAFAAGMASRMLEGGFDMIRSANNIILSSDIGHDKVVTTTVTPATKVATSNMGDVNLVSVKTTQPKTLVEPVIDNRGIPHERQV